MLPAWASFCLRALVVAGVAVVLVWGLAHGHPEDEFCIPGETALDPALCEALSALDSAEPGGDLSPEAQSLLADLEGRSALQTLSLYIRIGIEHIVPGGLDHILFVLGIVLSTPRLKSLAFQISAFTVAHTATLALAATGIVSPPAAIVEPLIAASIAFVAVEALFLKEPPRWRLALVFAFGLVHGLGFAGAFGELGLPRAQFWPGLLGFNIGVEIGQIGVATLAMTGIWLAARETAKKSRDHPRWIVWPAAAVISATGLFWTFERVLDGMASG